ncbi:MAG: HEAT repeat domain-containing protein [Bradymonadia bacterium]|jgi:HEAT repeat protein
MLTWWRPVALSLLVGVFASSCAKPDPNAPETWIAKLEGGERMAAIQKLGEMKAKVAVEPLKNAWKSGLDRSHIVMALSKIDDPSAASTMLEALQGTDAQLADLAGQALKKWKSKEFADQYLAIATNLKAPREARNAALEMLAMFPEERFVDALVPILEGDPERDPIVFNGHAAEALGKLRSEKAIPGLIACMWLDDHLRRNEVPRCRLALTRVGVKAVPALIETLQRKNRVVEERARKFQYDKGGLIEAKVAEALGDMPDPSAVEPLVAALKVFDEMPAHIQDPRKAQAFVMSGVQKVISIASALASLGDERAVDALLGVANDKELALEHKLASVQQLAFLGSQKAIPGLMKLLSKMPSAEDPVSNGFHVQVSLNAANLMNGSDPKAVDALAKQLESIQATLATWIADAEKKWAAATDPQEKAILRANIDKGYKEWSKNHAEAQAKVTALKACGTDTACWVGKLKEEDAVRVKAAYQLVNETTNRDAALQGLASVIHHEDLVLRNIAIFGIGRLGGQSAVPIVKAAREIDAQKAEKDRRLEGAVYTMDLLIARLEQR